MTFVVVTHTNKGASVPIPSKQEQLPGWVSQSSGTVSFSCSTLIIIIIIETLPTCLLKFLLFLLRETIRKGITLLYQTYIFFCKAVKYWQRIAHINTKGKACLKYVLFSLRKSAAVINNLEASPAMHSFKSSQLAASLSPLQYQSVIRASCKPPITSIWPHYSLVFLMPQLLLQKYLLLLQFVQLVFS